MRLVGLGKQIGLTKVLEKEPTSDSGFPSSPASELTGNFIGFGNFMIQIVEF